MSIFTQAFWRAAGERAIVATAASAAGTLAASGAGLIDANWVGCFSAAGMIGVITLLSAIGADAATGGTGPSLTGAEVPSENVAAIDTSKGLVAGPAAAVPNGTPIKIERQTFIGRDGKTYYVDDPAGPPVA